MSDQETASHAAEIPKRGNSYVDAIRITTSRLRDNHDIEEIQIARVFGYADHWDVRVTAVIDTESDEDHD